MIKLKPLQITDFYAPITNLTKIADFGKSVSDAAASVPKKSIAPSVPSPIVPPNPVPINALPQQAKSNTLIYALLVIVIVAGAVIIVNRSRRREERNEEHN